MSIRVVCGKCASVLKIKEELAGTKGKCPKCKTPFLVPQVGESDESVATAATPTAAAVGDAASVKDSQMSAPTPETSTPPLPATGGAHAEPTPSKPTDQELKTAKKTDPEVAAIAESVKKPAPKPVKETPAKNGDEFDPFEFLMADGGPKAKPSPPPPRPEPPGPPRGPAGKAPGRRLELSEDETGVPGGAQDTVVPTGRAVPRSAAESANAMLTGAATAASARDLLAKSAQESRTRAGQMPLEPTAPKADYGALFKEIIRSFGPYIAATIVLSIFLYWMVDRMLGSPLNLPKLAPVYGKVTVDGQPLAGVTVVFTPLGTKDPEIFKGKEHERPRDAMGITNEQGEYEIMYLTAEGIDGAVVGKNRVWIKPETPEDYKRVPPQYQNAATSGRIEDVKPGGGEINLTL